MQRTSKSKRKTRKQRKQRRQRGGAIAINTYTSVLGSGGFGLILAEPSGSRVVKLYYDPGACRDMNKEFEMLQRVYTAFQEHPIPQVLVPQPIQVDNTPFQYQGREVLCGIEMSRLQPIALMRDAKNPMVHVILKKEYEAMEMINKELGRGYGKPISDENPSRGFFAGPTYIEETLLPSLSAEQKGILTSTAKISETLGKIFGVILGVAGVIPNDVEYCLVMHNGQLHIAVLDFGMAIEFPTGRTKDEVTTMILKGDKAILRATGIEYDLYFPNREDELYAPFEAGMKEVLTSLATAGLKRNVLSSIIEKYNQEL